MQSPLTLYEYSISNTDFRLGHVIYALVYLVLYVPFSCQKYQVVDLEWPWP